MSGTAKFTAWSYSRLADYERCPLRAKLKHLDHLPEPPNPAMQRGSEAHEALARYVGGVTSKIPEVARAFASRLRKIRALQGGVAVELRWGLDAAWRLTSWFGDATRLRVVVDLLVDAPAKRGTKPEPTMIVDYKTGKESPSHVDQARLYAVSAFHVLDPTPDEVRVEFWYLDSGVTRERVFHGVAVDGERAAWEKRVAPMLADRKFVPRPGNHCRWCPYSASKGGPCKF